MKSRKMRYTFRKIRTRKKLFGMSDKPRLAIYRSLKHIYAQVIDDVEGKTLAAASSSDKKFPKSSGIKAATLVGESVAKLAVKKGIKQVIFDRAGRSYHGRVKAVAEGARAAGLKI